MPLENLEEQLEETDLVDKKEAAKQRGLKIDGAAEQEQQHGPPKDIYEKVVKFTNIARKQYGDLIKSVLIFGSAAQGKMVQGSDADIWVILDDTATKGTEDLEKVNSALYLVAHELKDLHVQTTVLTEFWQWIRMGSPELVNFLRYGLIIYDTGFMKPVQKMLQMGLIPPSEETIGLKARAADVRLMKLKIDMKSMIFELRYTALDIIQAVVMYYYKKQPDYKTAPEFLEKLIKDKKLEKIYLKKFETLNKLWKDIDHKIIKDATTLHLEQALTLASEIVERMKKLLPKEILGEELPKLE